MSDIAKIKEIDIVQYANSIGCKVYGRGKALGTKHNPLRPEKTSSLKIYPATNTWNDFGGETGTIIDMCMIHFGLSTADAIEKLKREHNIGDTKDYEIVTVPKKLAPLPQQEYTPPSVIRKIFDQQKDLNFKLPVDKKHLDTYAPKWVFQSSDEDSIKFFVDSVRHAKHTDTTMVLLRDFHGVERCLRYRYKTIGDELKKWVVMSGAEAHFLYTRLTENPLTIVTEGTSDYLMAVLLGFSVISLPSAGYTKALPPELTKDRILVFMGDDGEAGQKCIDEIEHNTICEKKRFNYNDFRAKYNKKGEDFKDIVCEYRKKETFTKDFLEYIDSLDTKDDDDWYSIIKERGKTVTRETIKEVEDTKFLYEGVLPSQQITTLVGEPNVGKSAISFGFANHLFDTKQIDQVLYFDNDNALAYTKDRILKLKDRNGDDAVNFYSGSTASKDDMIEELGILTKFKLQGLRVLIVIDSLKDFVNGTINSDEAINEFYDIVKSVRDVFGATIIILHHTKKNKDDAGHLEYIGSQAIRASTDNMTYIFKDDVSSHLLLNNDKARAMITEKVALGLDFENMTLTDEIYVEASEEDGSDFEVAYNKWDGSEIVLAEFTKNIKDKGKKEITALKKEGAIKMYKNNNEWVIKKDGAIEVEEIVFEMGEVL